MEYEGTNLSVLGSCYSIAISDKVRYGRVALFKLYSLYADTYRNKYCRSNRKNPTAQSFPSYALESVVGLRWLPLCAPDGDGVPPGGAVTE